MISRLDLEYFKCFELLKLPLGKLTLLAGSNASGKSSVLQSLVLLQQTMREHEWSTRLMLNGDSINLGTVSDVIDKVNGRKSFDIGLQDDVQSFAWRFVGERSEMSMAIESVTAGDIKQQEPDKLRYLLPAEQNDSIISLAKRLTSLTYITAERVGPREVYDLHDRQIADVVGPAGESLSVLHWGRDESVIEGLVVEQVPNTRLRQVEERMRMFFPGCALEVQQVPQANAVTLGLRTSVATDFHRPIHVGLDLPKFYPLLYLRFQPRLEISCLLRILSFICIQLGKLTGKFLSDVARAGIQVIVETHSDHVLNGIRRSVKAKCLESEHVMIHFFRPRSDDLSQVVSPQLDSSGNVDIWPEGFFDQYDKDMNYFAEWE